MMKGLFRNLAVAVSSGFLFGCFLCESCCDDCGPPSYLYYQVRNETLYDAVLTTYELWSGDTITPSGLIAAGDTLRYKENVRFARFPTRNVENPGFTASLEFDSDPVRCLVFSGQIVDTFFDIRSTFAYMGQGNSYFEITEAHFDSAVACP
jgi:hypothetical protein